MIHCHPTLLPSSLNSAGEIVPTTLIALLSLLTICTTAFQSLQAQPSWPRGQIFVTVLLSSLMCLQPGTLHAAQAAGKIRDRVGGKDASQMPPRELYACLGESRGFRAHTHANSSNFFYYASLPRNVFVTSRSLIYDNLSCNRWHDCEASTPCPASDCRRLKKGSQA